jgi:pimeloyl-ACP methyl ester carboxylesterase
MSLDCHGMRSRRVPLRTGPTLRVSERAGSGGTLLLLHGYSDSGRSFEPVVPWLPADWRVLAPDQRGHGDSDRPEGGYAMAELAADAAALLDEAGVASATVVGHSMGSLVAQQLVLDHPRRVARLVLIGGAPRMDPAVVALLESDVRALGDPVPEAFVRGFQVSTIRQPVPGARLEQAIAESRKLPARVWRALLDGFAHFDVTACLGEVACPTLLVWGAHDAYFGRADQERLLAGIPGARLRVYEEAGHATHWEEPARFAHDLAAFVAAGRAPRPSIVSPALTPSA